MVVTLCIINHDQLSDTKLNNAGGLAQPSASSPNAGLSNGFEGELSRVQLSQHVLSTLRRKKLERDFETVKTGNIGEPNAEILNGNDLVRCECGWQRDIGDV